MRKRALLIAALLFAAPFAAQAATLAPDLPHTALVVIEPDHSGEAFDRLRTAEPPITDTRETRYVASASGLDRIDPADFKVFGAEIGGNGVQGGAVVSLSWPTER